jgi:hypothetical protein
MKLDTFINDHLGAAPAGLSRYNKRADYNMTLVRTAADRMPICSH